VGLCLALSLGVAGAGCGLPDDGSGPALPGGDATTQDSTVDALESPGDTGSADTVGMPSGDAARDGAQTEAGRDAGADALDAAIDGPTEDAREGGPDGSLVGDAPDGAPPADAADATDAASGDGFDGYVASYTLGGNISGYTGSGLQLGDGTGSPISLATGATSFVFPALPGGSAYTVTVAAQPSAPAESCSATANASGTLESSVSDVQVTCIPTPSCAPRCAVGATCGAASDCLTATCAGGTCQKGGAGAPCAETNGNCLSNSCGGTDDTCQKGAAMTPCLVSGDCLSNVCDDGTCQLGQPGTPCNFTNGNCFSNSCTGDTCAEGGAGTTCLVAGDCLSNVCTSGACARGSAGTGCADTNGNCLSNDCGGIGDTCQLGAATTDCVVAGDCLSNVCNDGTCQLGQPGTPCNFTNGNCFSNSCSVDTCAAGGAGTTCLVAGDCLSNVCTRGACAKGGAGTPCDATNGNCLSNSCGGIGDTCQLGAAMADCVVAGDCLSNVCTGGTCQRGAAGTTCNFTNGNCLSNNCAGDTCALGVDGASCDANTDCGSQVCSGPGGTCSPPACASANPKCAAGSPCGSNGDCQSGLCNISFACQ
jgi:hypothetical protein